MDTTPPAKQLSLTLAATLALAACSGNPDYRTDIASRSYAALGDLYVLLAKADLGALRAPSSYPASVDSYAAVLGGFRIGGLLARLPSDAGAPPDDIEGTLTRCLDRVREMANRHKAQGVAPGDPLLGTVRTACDTAARWVAADEASSWVLNTFAGDL
jgi:hypothetical protein